jgi:hypothetical protein
MTRGTRVDPLLEEYQQFHAERKCGQCTHFKCEPWSIRTGICEVFAGVVQRHWQCVLDGDGKLRVTRQKIV